MFLVVNLWLIFFKRFSFNKTSCGQRMTFFIFNFNFNCLFGVEKKFTGSVNVNEKCSSVSFKIKVFISLKAVCGWKMKKSSFLFVIAFAAFVWPVVGSPFKILLEKSPSIWNLKKIGLQYQYNTILVWNWVTIPIQYNICLKIGLQYQYNTIFV